ncbi:MAG: hypothetical protein Q9178_002701 [Gyalolechia marmorata]
MAPILRTGQTLMGQSGHPYCLQKVLYEREDIKKQVWLACSGETPYVIKPVPHRSYNLAFALRTELSFCPLIRFPVDGIESGLVDELDSGPQPWMGLVFHYHTENFLSLMQSGPVSRPQVKRILHDVLKAIAAMHNIKPNNVMVSYKTLNDGTREIESVALIDTEDAAKLKETQAIYNQVGNVLWRSPEAQAGICVQNSTDIWSFGATALYGITRRVVFAYDDLEEGVLPEVAVVENQLSYFGPLTKGLFDLMETRDSVWGSVFLNLMDSFDDENPPKPFALWKGIDEFLPGDKEFFLRIMKLTPADRPTAEKLLEDPWFSLPYA